MGDGKLASGEIIALVKELEEARKEQEKTQVAPVTCHRIATFHSTHQYSRKGLTPKVSSPLALVARPARVMTTWFYS